MNGRDAAIYRSLLQIVHFVNGHDSLRERAAESNALTLLQQHIGEIQELESHRAVASMATRGMTAQKDDLYRILRDRLDAIRHAADFARISEPGIPPMEPPSLDLDVTRFIAAARGISMTAAEHEEALIAAGLQRSIIADCDRLADILQKLSLNRIRGRATRMAANQQIPIVLRSSRGLVKLLRRQLEPVMTPEILVEWQRAIALGRTHRPKALKAGAVSLPAPVNFPRLAAPLPQHKALAPSMASTKLGIGRVVQHIVLRLVHPMGHEQQHAPDAEVSEVSDVSIEQIKRLPASTAQRTGTDDG